jgi:hypothetical protein
MRAQLDTTRRQLNVRRSSVTKMEAWNSSRRSAAVAAYAALERATILSIELRETISRRYSRVLLDKADPKLA